MKEIKLVIRHFVMSSYRIFGLKFCVIKQDDSRTISNNHNDNLVTIIYQKPNMCHILVHICHLISMPYILQTFNLKLQEINYLSS